MLFDAWEHFIIDHIRTCVLGETVEKHVDRYFQAVKATEQHGERLLRSKRFLAPIVSFVQTDSMDAITDQHSVNIFASPFKATDAKEDAVVTAEAKYVPNYPVRRAEKVVSHYRKATALKFKKTEEKATRQATQNQQCLIVTLAPARKPSATIAWSA